MGMGMRMTMGMGMSMLMTGSGRDGGWDGMDGGWGTLKIYMNVRALGGLVSYGC